MTTSHKFYPQGIWSEEEACVRILSGGVEQLFPASNSLEQVLEGAVKLLMAAAAAKAKGGASSEEEEVESDAEEEEFEDYYGDEDFDQDSTQDQTKDSPRCYCHHCHLTGSSLCCVQ